MSGRDRQRKRERERERPLFRKETTAQKDPWNFHVEERNVRQENRWEYRERIPYLEWRSFKRLSPVHSRHLLSKNKTPVRRENSKRHFSLFETMCIEISIEMLSNVFESPRFSFCFKFDDESEIFNIKTIEDQFVSSI